MSDGSIETAGELLAHAYRMEIEAQERYEFLADQMETANNVELMALFRKLAKVEGLHAREIRDRMSGMDMPEISPLAFKWRGGESPEAIDPGDMHYLMRPREALLLALRAEEKAYAFFGHFLEVADDEEVKRLAGEFAREEKEHVDLVRRELQKYPQTGEAPRDDMDPAVGQE